MQAIFAYIPVVHSGTITFLEKYKDLPIFLLDNTVAKNENPYLERDIRALPASYVAVELIAHGYTNVEVLSPTNLSDTFAKYSKLIVPEDEIIDYFLTTYIPDKIVERIPIFLRWTKQISTTENVVSPNRVINDSDFENSILSNLTDEAQKSPDWWRQIGSAIVQNGKVILSAHNKHFPSQHALTINGDPRSNLDAGQGPGIYTSIHAEANLLALAAHDGLALDGADIFVTTFPCPTCARSLVVAGIKRVYYKNGYSLLDAEEILSGAGIEIILVKEKI